MDYGGAGRGAGERPLAAQLANEAAPPPRQSHDHDAARARGNSVGPPQLRDFNLNGTVTQPAQPVTPAPTPRRRQRRARRPRPRRATASDACAGRRRPRPAVPRPRAIPRPAGSFDLPPTPAAPIADAAPAPEPTPVAEASPIADTAAAEAPGLGWWPWLAALLALVLGAGFLWWRRQHDGERYATDHGDVRALVATPDAAPAPAPLPRAAATPPAARAPSPVPAPPVPAPAPLPEGIVASRLTPPPITDGIVSSRLKPAWRSTWCRFAPRPTPPRVRR